MFSNTISSASAVVFIDSKYASNPMKHIKIQHYKGNSKNPTNNFYYPATLINVRGLNNNADVSENLREQM